MTTYTPVGVIREELREALTRRAEMAGDSRLLQDLHGAHYGPLISVKSEHSDYCECEKDQEVCWSNAAVRLALPHGQRPPFAWAGGAK